MTLAIALALRLYVPSPKFKVMIAKNPLYSMNSLIHDVLIDIEPGGI